ncbi:MAG: sodium-dependent transporter [Deltaproteobacteria bacterium]|nr:sodium-dependent transporter [Deltaproteobacteria bacterium]
MATSTERESLGSRLGFILLAAGCAIGLGNVWRFPYITGKYGGAAFVLMYLIFLIALGLPIMVMELAVGRAARQNIGRAFQTLEPAGSKWHIFGPIGIAGNYLLMMFYTVVTGWILAYVYHTAAGDLTGLGPSQIKVFFGRLLGNPAMSFFWMALTVASCFFITGIGLQKGVERVCKIMMAFLFILILALAFHSVMLPGALPGLRFYLLPDMERLLSSGGGGAAAFAAMGQAFFTLGLGIGSMAIFGSYIGKERSLPGESIRIIGLDTFVALMSGLVIFPACFAFGVNPDSGPGLLFVTLPNIFNQMPGGRLWGTVFFIFMSFAAVTTVIAVFENIVSYWIDVRGWSRRRASGINCAALIVLSLPCVLGFNLLSGIEPLGAGSNILDLEDFLLSTMMLPAGALVFIFFTTSRYGWGLRQFLSEANTGKGLTFPRWTGFYMRYILPFIILMVFIKGYWDILKG